VRYDGTEFSGSRINRVSERLKVHDRWFGVPIRLHAAGAVVCHAPTPGHADGNVATADTALEFPLERLRSC
jgi:hypothetical protein